MTEELNSGGLPATRKKYTPALKAECGRQVAAGAWQNDVARAQGILPALLGRWQSQALEAADPSRYGTRWLRAELCAEGHAVGRYAQRSWLYRYGLHALSTRPQRPRTIVADPAAVVAESRLLGRPAPTAPNRVWVGRTR